MTEKSNSVTSTDLSADLPSDPLVLLRLLEMRYLLETTAWDNCPEFVALRAALNAAGQSSQETGTAPSDMNKAVPAALYVWLVPSEHMLDQPGSWRIRKWDTEPFPEATHVVPILEGRRSSPAGALVDGSPHRQHPTQTHGAPSVAAEIGDYPRDAVQCAWQNGMELAAKMCESMVGECTGTEFAAAIRAALAEPAPNAAPVRKWYPHESAEIALDELRRSCAELIGANPETWPDHGNAPLAIAASLGLADSLASSRSKTIEELRSLYVAPREGWKLVPVKPTEEMLTRAVASAWGEAVFRSVGQRQIDADKEAASEMWTAMLASVGNSSQDGQPK